MRTVWVQVKVDAQTGADVVGARERVEMGGEKDRWTSADVRTRAQTVDARERVEMVGEKDRWA